MKLEIPKRIEPRETPAEGFRIPAAIFQTFETAEVPERMHEAAMTWVERNPGFAYRFFDADDRRAFIAGHFDARTLAAYDRIEGGAFRADFWRYCVLHVEGGVYADVDSLCETGLANLLEPGDAFVTSRAGNLEWALYNGFICAAPDHPFLKRAIERATDMIHRLRPGEPFEGYTITGPATLGSAVNEVLGRRPKTPHEWGRHEVGDHRYRILRKVPRRPDAPGCLVDGERLILYTEYPEYRGDLSETGVVHWQEAARAGNGPITRLRRRARRLLRRVI